MLQGILRRVFVGIFLFFAAIGMCYHAQNPTVVSEQPCVHQYRFFIESFQFLVPMFSKASKMRFFVGKCRFNVVFHVYCHEMV